MKTITQDIQVHPALENNEGKRSSVKIIVPAPNHQFHNPIMGAKEYFLSTPNEFINRKNKGIELINYVIDGGLDHKNQIENKYTSIISGELIRCTATEDFTYSERPLNRGVNQGIKIWFALDKEHKQKESTYQICHEKDFHIEQSQTYYIKTLSGKKSPLKLCNEVELKDILLHENAYLELDIPENHQGFIYVISGLNGNLYELNHKIKPAESLFFSNTNQLILKSGPVAVRFIFISCKRLPEEILNSEILMS